MSLFDWLLVTHLIGDFVLQTNEMAARKRGQLLWTLRHVAVYLVGVSVVISAYAVRHTVSGILVVLLVLFLGGTHTLLDRTSLVKWVMGGLKSSPDHPWLPIVVDQVMHLFTLAIVAQILVWAVR